MTLVQWGRGVTSIGSCSTLMIVRLSSFAAQWICHSLNGTVTFNSYGNRQISTPPQNRYPWNNRQKNSEQLITSERRPPKTNLVQIRPLGFLGKRVKCNKIIFIARQNTDARYWYSNYVRPSVSVCLAVCPSVRNAPVSDENGLTYWRSFFAVPYGRPIILVLPASNIFTIIRRGHPLRGR